MSFKAAAWAIHQQPNTAYEKLVLIVLADHFNENNTRCDPSTNRLAEFCLCTPMTVKTVIKNLEDQGYISCERNTGIRTKYTLNIDTKAVKDVYRYNSFTGKSHDKSGKPDAQSGKSHDKSGKPPLPEPVITSNKQEETKDVVLPSFIDPELWDGFLEIRKGLKAKNTPLALTKIINRLTGFYKAGMNPNLSIENSVMNSWKGVFAPTKNQTGETRKKQEFKNT